MCVSKGEPQGTSTRTGTQVGHTPDRFGYSMGEHRDSKILRCIAFLASTLRRANRAPGGAGKRRDARGAQHDEGARLDHALSRCRHLRLEHFLRSETTIRRTRWMVFVQPRPFRIERPLAIALRGQFQRQAL